MAQCALHMCLGVSVCLRMRGGRATLVVALFFLSGLCLKKNIALLYPIGSKGHSCCKAQLVARLVYVM